MLFRPDHNGRKIKSGLDKGLHQEPGRLGSKLQRFFRGSDKVVVLMELIRVGFADHNKVFLQEHIGKMVPAESN